MASSAFGIDAHAVALHRGEHGGERQVDRLVDFREALRLHFRAKDGREALQVIRVLAGSAGERAIHGAATTSARVCFDVVGRNR